MKKTTILICWAIISLIMLSSAAQCFRDWIITGQEWKFTISVVLLSLLWFITKVAEDLYE